MIKRLQLFKSKLSGKTFTVNSDRVTLPLCSFNVYSVALHSVCYKSFRIQLKVQIFHTPKHKDRLQEVAGDPWLTLSQITLMMPHYTNQ